MANLTIEQGVFPDGIYQLELTNFVTGGASGVSNLQAKQLGARTEWLRRRSGSAVSVRATAPSTDTLSPSDAGGLIVCVSDDAVHIPATTSGFQDGDRITIMAIGGICEIFTGNDHGYFYNNQRVTFLGTNRKAYISPGRIGEIYVYDEEFYVFVHADAMDVENGGVPLGSIINVQYANDAYRPSSYLRCDGSAISRTTYATLFSAIGTIYGPGNGTTTFNIPNEPNHSIRAI